MQRRKFILFAASSLAVLAVGRRVLAARHGPPHQKGIGPLGFADDLSDTPPKHSTLRLVLERKRIEADCMLGYLLTQVAGESSATPACYVLELPPRGNAPFVSAIPEGTYPVHVRSEGDQGWRLELKDVPDRESVEIHVGNYPANTLGCLLPGKGLGTGCQVTDSAAAMKELRILFAVFGTDHETTITIRDAL